jgi:hypothetical protein
LREYQNVLIIRRWHAYLGLLIAPSVLFFALTGALQLFGLHESRGSYKPPALIEKLGSVHKDQVFAAGHHGGPPPAAAHDAAPGHDDDDHDHDPGNSQGQGDHDDNDALSTTLLKWYFLVVALALAVSTGFGVWMGLTQMRRTGLAWTLLVIGTVVPVTLLVL